MIDLAPPPVTRKLDLAAGQSPRQGFEGVDIWSGAQHVVDLMTFPWPFADESVLELNCSHYIEHIPMVYVGPDGAIRSVAQPGDKDALLAFFDECYRILVPEGWMHVQWPSHRNDRAFQDPTHRRFPTAQTVLYLNEEWRRANRLDHYNVSCNFGGLPSDGAGCQPVASAALTLRIPEVAAREMNNYWNSVIDWMAKIQKKPRLP